MSDLFTSLRQEDPAVGLPADEVRRLGDRARRRRTAVRAAGATCVVAAVAAASLALGTGTPRTAPDPASPDPGPSPTRAVAPEPDRLVPSGFPLSRGLPMSAGTPDLAGPAAAPFSGVIPPVCGTAYSLAGDPVDRLAMEGTSAVFQGVRDLAVYDSPGQALRAVEEQAQRLRDCPTERGAGSLATTTVEPLGVGDQGVAGDARLHQRRHGGERRGLLPRPARHRGARAGREPLRRARPGRQRTGDRRGHRARQLPRRAGAHRGGAADRGAVPGGDGLRRGETRSAGGRSGRGRA